MYLRGRITAALHILNTQTEAVKNNNKGVPGVCV